MRTFSKFNHGVARRKSNGTTTFPTENTLTCEKLHTGPFSYYTPSVVTNVKEVGTRRFQLIISYHTQGGVSRLKL